MSDLENEVQEPAAPGGSARVEPSHGSQSEATRWRRILPRAAAALAVTVVTFWFLLPDFDLQRIGAILAGSDLWLLMAAALAFVAGQAGRGWRLQLVLVRADGSGRVGFDRAWAAASLHAFWSALLPMRLGEATLPILLQRWAGRGLAEATGLLLILRLVDLGVILGIAALAGALVLPAGSAPALLMPLGLAAVAGLALFPPLGRVVALRLMRLQTGGRGGGVLRLIQGLSRTLVECGVGRLYALTAVTLLQWAGFFAGYLLAALAVGPIPILAALFAAAIGNCAFVLPVNGLGQLGPYQAAYVAAAGMAGVGAELALAISLMLHAAGFLVGAVQALAALWLARRFAPIAPSSPG